MSTTKTTKISPEKDSSNAEGPSAEFIAAISEFINPESEVAFPVKNSPEEQKASHHGTGRRRALPLSQNFMAGKIRERRRQLRLTQAQLAERLGVSHSLVSHWEQAKTRVMADDLEPLAAALETSRAYLVGGPSVVEYYQVKDHPVSEVVVGLEELIRTPTGVTITRPDLIELRDRHEQTLLNGFRALTDVRREIVLRLVADLGTLP